MIDEAAFKTAMEVVQERDISTLEYACRVAIDQYESARRAALPAEQVERVALAIRNAPRTRRIGIQQLRQRGDGPIETIQEQIEFIVTDESRAQAALLAMEQPSSGWMLEGEVVKVMTDRMCESEFCRDAVGKANMTMLAQYAYRALCEVATVRRK